MPHIDSGLRELAAKAMTQDVLNVIEMVRRKEPITASQRTRLEEVARRRIDTGELLEALDVLRSSVCESCRDQVEVLIDNVREAG